MSNARQRLAAAAIVAALAVLVGLGTWQLARRAEKHALIARIEARMKAPPIALPAGIEDPDDLDYRRVFVTGRFLHGGEMRVLNRVLKGRAGVHVVTPLARDEGPAVLVNRGWAPTENAAQETRPGGLPGGRVTVTGVARVPPPPAPFVPANDPARGLWFAPDIAAMAAAQGLGAVAPVIVWADAAPPGAAKPEEGGSAAAAPERPRHYPWGGPWNGQARPEPRDDHLYYALTWYSLALALAVIVVIARRRRPEPRP